jgi:hypothetical protein
MKTRDDRPGLLPRILSLCHPRHAANALQNDAGHEREIGAVIVAHLARPRSHLANPSGLVKKTVLR